MNNNLSKVLNKHRKRIQKSLSKHKIAYEWLVRNGLSVAELRQKSANLIATGALGGTLLFSPGVPTDIQNVVKAVTQNVYANQMSGPSVRVSLAAALAPVLPQKPEPLTPDKEAMIGDLFSKYIGISAKASLDSNHLPTTYGYTGAEQHLARFPGDSIYGHDEQQAEGMAPGLGAWGYFANSKNELTSEQIAMEKYYIAAQTFDIPQWNTNQPYLKNWYKYRKVIVVNPRNGEAAVAVIGDAGPADWTGKQFGASPELMHHLKLDFGMKKGEIIVFFVDDPQNKVPIGPINYDNIKLTI